MTVELTAETPFNDEPEVRLPSTAQVLAVLTAIAKIIGVRLGLLLALVGGFIVALRVIENGNPGPNAIWALGLYLSLTILPLAFLNATRAS